VQTARNSDENSKKIKEQRKKSKPKPMPQRKWILDLQGSNKGRWIDPIGSNPRSKGQDAKPSEPGLNQTGSLAYIRVCGPVQFIPFLRFSLYISDFSPFSLNFPSSSPADLTTAGEDSGDGTLIFSDLHGSKP
jgi:hypothetical protein